MTFRAIAGDGPLRVVLVGAGGMGRAWMRTIRSSGCALLVGVVDVVPGAADRAIEELRREDGAGATQEPIAAGTDLLATIGECGAEAVIDVTIPAAHHPVTVQALRAGLPVLGEKPCAATLAEAISLAGHAEETGELFMVSQSRRHNPHLLEARRLAHILGGAGLVDTRFFRAPHFGGFREEMAHPLIVDMAIHAFDAGRTLLEGVPAFVDATSANPPWSWYAGDAVADVSIGYGGGVLHTYTGSWCSPGRETSWNGEWMLSCAEGSVHWDGENVPMAVTADGEVVPGTPPGASDLWEFDAALAEFCAALRTGQVPPSEVHANIWTQAIVEAAVRSAHEHRRVLTREVLDEALAEARRLDAREGLSTALEAWETGTARLTSA